MQSRNPVLSRRGTFTSSYIPRDATLSDNELQQMYGASAGTPVETRRMTLDDVVAKTTLTLLTLLAAGGLTWALTPPENFTLPIIGMIVGFVLAMVIVFKRTTSPPLILAYAAAEGVFLGGISHALNTVYEGIVVQAVLGTAMAFVAMLAAYKSRLIRVTPRFTKILIGATVGFLLAALANFVLNLAGVELGLRDAGPLGLMFTLVGAILASLFLVLDFNMIEEGIKRGAPEREAWLGAFALTVTLVWLYLEILRLLAILRAMTE